jgi:hypothetical protein
MGACFVSWKPGACGEREVNARYDSYIMLVGRYAE